ncbi:MAG: DUF6279 family lipoprotein [Burkholderiales bacterium]
MSILTRIFSALVLLLLLNACSSLRFSYNNAETGLRYMAWDYLDVDAEQADKLQAQFERLRQWHRSSELPRYESAFAAAKEKVSKGLARSDIEWAITTVRAHTRLLASRAAQDAAPVLATLKPEQINVLGKKFAKENTRYTEQWIASDGGARTRKRFERMVDQIEDWTGRLNPTQRSMVERYISSHSGDFERRLEERRRWQRELIAILIKHKTAPELASPMMSLFSEPEKGQSKIYVEDLRRWESGLAELFLALDATLLPDQRSRILARLDRYMEDFRALSAVRQSAESKIQTRELGPK